MTYIRIPPVRTFDGVKPSKAQALKPLEEAAEVFGAWQTLSFWYRPDIMESYPDIDMDGTLDLYKGNVVEECCDVIMATCNLLAALGVTDLKKHMAKCEQRNEKRGRYGKRH